MAAPFWDNSVELPSNSLLGPLRKSGFYIIENPADGPEPGVFHVLVLNATTRRVRKTYQIVWSVSTGNEFYRTADNMGYTPWASRTGSGGPGGPVTAIDVSFNNAGSGLTSTNVQAAIEEIVAMFGGLDEDLTDAEDLLTTLEGRLIELEGDLETVETKLATIEEGAEVNDDGATIVEKIDAALGSDTWQGGATMEGTDIDVTPGSDSVSIDSSTGGGDTISAATTTLAGVMSAADKTKLDGIQAGAEVNPTGAAIVGTIDTELGSPDWRTGASGPVAAENVSVDDDTFTNIEGSDVQAILADIDDKIGNGGPVGPIAAEDVSFDPTGTELAATDVQAVIAELLAIVPAAEDVSFDPSGTVLSATDVQAAIAELEAIVPAAMTPEDIGDAIDLLLGSNAWRFSEFTDLGNNTTATTVTVTSSTGEDTTLPAATTSNAGVMTAADKTKLDSVETGAEVNPTGSDIVAAINAELGSVDWQGAAGSDQPATPTVRVVSDAHVPIVSLVDSVVIDDVTLEDGDLVLLVSQLNPTENGIYMIGVTPARPPQYNSFIELSGAIISVQEGEEYAESVWLCTSDHGGEIDIDPLTFVRTSIAPTNISTRRDASQVFIDSTTGTSGVIGAATSVDAGVMTAADKAKLDGIETGAQLTDISIDRSATTVTVVSSDGNDGTIPGATTTQAGVMVAADKAKLDGIEAGATTDMLPSEIVAAVDTALGNDLWQVPGTVGAAEDVTVDDNAFTNIAGDDVQEILADIDDKIGAASSTDITVTSDANTVTLASSTGDGDDIPTANGTNAGVMSAAQATKLDGIEAGAQVNPTAEDIVDALDTELGSADWRNLNAVTDIGVEPGASVVELSSSTGEGDTIPAATTTEAGVMTAADKTKLDGIAEGAQVNPTGAAIVSAIDTELGHDDWQSGGNSGPVAAEDVTVDDSAFTVIEGTDVQSILSDIDSKIGNGGGSGGPVDAADVDFDPTGTELTATDVQAAILELDNKVESVDDAIGTLNDAVDTLEGTVSSQGSKLAGIESGAEVNPTGAEIVGAIDTELGSGWRVGVTTDLAANPDADSVEITSSSGDPAEIPAATTSLAGVMTAADKTKLDGIASGAEVNPEAEDIRDMLDTLFGSTDWRDSFAPGEGGGETSILRVRAATTGNVDINTQLNPGDTLDGIVLALNDLVLVKNQTNPAQNGIYLATPTPVGRPVNYNSFEELFGAIIMVPAGAANAGTVWQCSVPSTGTIGTDPVNFTKIAPTNLSTNVTSTAVEVRSDTGADVTLGGASHTQAGILLARDYNRLRFGLVHTVAFGNVDLSLGITGGINGVNVNANHIVLVMGQTNPEENGIYMGGSGPAQRHPSFTSWADFVGTSIYVILGSEAGRKYRAQIFTDSGTLGTHALPFDYDDVSSTIVKVATTGNITIASGLNNGDSIDGVTLANGDLVLVKDQTNAAQNGIYTVGTQPNRLSEWRFYDKYIGRTFTVASGSVNGGKAYRCTSQLGGTLGTTALNFEVVSAAIATTTSPGYMSAEDKTKLDGIEAGAEANQTATEIVDSLDTELGGEGWRSGLTPDEEGQGPITGGASITPKDLGSIGTGTLTVDPSDCPYQKVSCSGAFTFSPHATSGAAVLFVTNVTGAGAITLDGWDDVIGASNLDSTEGSRFRIGIENFPDFRTLAISKLNSV